MWYKYDTPRSPHATNEHGRGFFASRAVHACPLLNIRTIYLIYYCNIEQSMQMCCEDDNYSKSVIRELPVHHHLSHLTTVYSSKI